ncbi:hypothetical protein ACOJVU_06865 [Mycobacterium sp. THU-M104]|uniref:hypothetical protein n=1 Tax=Mycobacterium sp. THU-M104 TaxID=3410515 RepID=UPI003B9D300C
MSSTASSTSPLPLPHTATPPAYPGTARRGGHRLRPAIVAASLLVTAVTGAAALTDTVRPSERTTPATTTARGMAIALTSAEPIVIDQGISITPAPGWDLVDRGTNWVTLADTDAGTRMRVTVKPAAGTDVVAALQADVANEVANTVLTNLAPSSGIDTKTVQGRNFQQAARMDYTADNTVGIDTTPILGVFMELLNPSNRMSAFIDDREASVSPAYIGSAAQAMINSML